MTSFDRLPSVDLGGFWRVTSTHSLFGNGVIRFEQDGTAISFEQSLLGKISDSSFTIGEDGADWMSGSVTGDTLNGRCALPLAGMASTGVFQAVRYTGPMYDVWQGTNALTTNQYYNPGTNGYTRIGQASTTATFVVSQPYLVVCANTLAPIDALQGPNSAFVAPATIPSIWTANTRDPDLLNGEPDSRSACVGDIYSGDMYRGYVAFGPVSWTSLTVNIGSPQPAPEEPPAPIPTNLLRQAFYLEYDSDGSSPSQDAEIALIFEPGGVAQLYMAFPDYALADRGTYSYANGRLSLSFTNEDFHPAVTFAMDLQSPKVTMPFDVFTPDTPGPSRWRREAAAIEHNMLLIFRGATINEQLPINDAIGRARAYAEALVQPAASGPASRQMLQADPPQYPILISTEPFANGVRLKYDWGDQIYISVDVLLFADAGAAGINRPLTTSPLAADPRVHLDPVAGLSGEDDPGQKKKTALFIFPSYTKRMLSWNPFNPAGDFVNEGGVLGFKRIKQKLEDRGYAVTALLDEEVTVVNLIEALRTSPGVVDFCTHATPEDLMTGTYLGTDWSTKGVNAAFEKQLDIIQKASYGDLLTCTYDGREAVSIIVVPNGMTRVYETHMLTITPAFWHWMRSKAGADFSRSLVYLGACHTSETNSLRHAIRARSLFSYDGAVSVGIRAAVGRYLMESLARKSHTAEETYYNLIRVVRTGEMIYKQDTNLNGNTTWFFDKTTTLADHLHGYATLGPNRTAGPDGIMEYKDIGWIGESSSGHMDAGDVWWLLFAGRWDQNAQSGAIGLFRCWDLYWSQSKSPPIGDWCVNCSPGTTPNQDEVAYATYLLTGEPVVPFGGIKAPRWTLNDGAPP
jgi:hypothetical protein